MFLSNWGLERTCVNWLTVLLTTRRTACLLRLWGNWSSSSVNKLLVSAQRLPRFLPQSKSMHIRLTGSSKWPVWCESGWMFVPLCWPIRWHVSKLVTTQIFFFFFCTASYQHFKAFYWCEEQNTQYHHVPQCLTKHSCQSHSEVNKKHLLYQGMPKRKHRPTP